MVVCRPQLGLEPGRITRFLHELLRLRNVVRPFADLDGIFDALRRDPLGRRRVAVECNLGQRFLVDRIGNRLPHFGIVEGLLLGVHRQIAEHDRRCSDNFQIRLAFQDLGLFIGNRKGEVRLARLHDGRARIVVDNGLPGDRVDLRITLLPVTVEFRDLEIVGLLPFDELERAGADGVEGDVLAAVLLQRRRADHHRGRMCELGDERRERRLQRNARGVIVDDLGLGDVVVVQAVALEMIFRIGHAIEVHLHRIGLEVGAVVKLDALFQLDRIGESVLADLVALGQHGNHLHVLVEPVQSFVEGFGHRLRQGVVGVVGVGRREGRGDGKDDVLGGERGRGGECSERRCGEQYRTKQRFHADSPG